MDFNKDELIKSPLIYAGSKYKLLPQILPLFPNEIDTFYDLFCGSGNVGINVKANKIICNDIINYISELFNTWKYTNGKDTMYYIDKIINSYDLNEFNQEGYNKLRNDFNKNKDIKLMYILSCYAFNYQIRFNNSHEFNSSYGKNITKFSDKLRKQLIDFITIIQNKNIDFTNKDYIKFNVENFNCDDFIYCDIPYSQTCGVYQDGKRGFNGWTIDKEVELYDYLDNLNINGIKWALSNVSWYRGIENILLNKWSSKYTIHNLNYNYNKNNRWNKDNSKFTQEVLITNY